LPCSGDEGSTSTICTDASFASVDGGSAGSVVGSIEPSKRSCAAAAGEKPLRRPLVSFTYRERRGSVDGLGKPLKTIAPLASFRRSLGNG
jgi:hypothetical protein